MSQLEPPQPFTAVRELLPDYGHAIADPTRLEILIALTKATSPVHVQLIATSLNIRPNTVSHHLLILARSGLVQRIPSGKYTLYSTSNAGVETFRELLTQLKGEVQA